VWKRSFFSSHYLSNLIIIIEFLVLYYFFLIFFLVTGSDHCLIKYIINSVIVGVSYLSHSWYPWYPIHYQTSLTFHRIVGSCISLCFFFIYSIRPLFDKIYTKLVIVGFHIFHGDRTKARVQPGPAESLYQLAPPLEGGVRACSRGFDAATAK